MTTPTIKKMFPGAITAKGFYSFYQYIVKNASANIYIIKGGPGVGKSTFMKKIAEEMVANGYDVELHCCSSDNHSLDAIVIPQLGIAVLDGTSPHIVDPQYPGAVDEIINFGDFWDKAYIKKAKAEIMECSHRNRRCYQFAYLCLQEALTALKEWEFYVAEHQDWNKVNQLYLEVEADLFCKRLNKLGKERHLFAWGHTPQGKVHHIDSLVTNLKRLYTLDGQPGTGKSTFLANIARRAIIMGYDVEYYHNPLDPEKLDLIILPEPRIGLVNVSEPYNYTPPAALSVISLNLNRFVNHGALSASQENIINCHRRVNEHIARAIDHLSKAKAEHDRLEQFYIPAMDFQAIEQKRRELVNNIMEIARQ